MSIKKITQALFRVQPVAINFGYRGGTLLGGPYAQANSTAVPPDAMRICMAAEVVANNADYVVPTHDFGTPDPKAFGVALNAAAKWLMSGGTVYVGCGYGIGRTGVFLAALVRMHFALLYLLEYKAGEGLEFGIPDPVGTLRALYLPSAVETPEQKKFVQNFDISKIVRRRAFMAKPSIVFDKRWWD